MAADRSTRVPDPRGTLTGEYGAVTDANASLKELSEFAAIATSLADSNNSLMDSRETSDQDDGSDVEKDGGMSDHKRLEHNVCERRRRNNIRQGFESLQGSIPHATMKLSKMEILRTGIAYINRLNKEISELEEEVRALRDQQEQLQEQT